MKNKAIPAGRARTAGHGRRGLRAIALLLCATPAWAAFTARPDATIADSATALTWDACAWGQARSGGACTGAAAPLTWPQALAAAQQANTGAHRGYTDWRVPNRTELESLALPAASPAIDAVFSNAAGTYWSNTSYQGAPAQAWSVDFSAGDSLPAAKTAAQTLRLVRGGTAASAYAPSPTSALPLTGGGTTAVQVSSPGGGCHFSSAQFVSRSSIDDPLPAGVALVGDLFDFVLDGCAAGETATIRITWPGRLPTGAQYWKHGPTHGDTTAHWYQHPATVSGNAIVFSITNGGDGDDDLDASNSQIVDAGGPGMMASGVPALSNWGLALLALLLGAGYRLRGRRRPS